MSKFQELISVKILSKRYQNKFWKFLHKDESLNNEADMMTRRRGYKMPSADCQEDEKQWAGEEKQAGRVRGQQESRRGGCQRAPKGKLV